MSCWCGHAKALHGARDRKRGEGRCLVVGCRCCEFEGVLVLSRAAARREALPSAAALLKSLDFTRVDGERVREDDDRTSDAFHKLNAERLAIAKMLARWGGVELSDLSWELD